MKTQFGVLILLLIGTVVSAAGASATEDRTRTQGSARPELKAGPNATVTDITTRVSVASGGAQGNALSEIPSISADGQFVAFESLADNLVPGDTNGYSDVFVHDRQSGTTTRVSVASDGAQGNGASVRPSISADGRFVAFDSPSDTLVPGDTNGYSDVFVHDRQSGTTMRVSVASGGGEGNWDSYGPSISADGRFVAFYSFSDNLVPGDTNRGPDIFVHDGENGTTTRVSVTSDGVQGNSSSAGNSLSGDGRFVAFGSAATNLVPGDTNGYSDVFVHDRQSGTTTRVSVASGGAEGNSWPENPSISADGRFVAFNSWADNLVPGDTNGKADVFVHDRENGTTTRVSVASDGTQGSDFSFYPSISADGRFVAFYSFSDNLVPGDTNRDPDIFVYDRQSGTTTHISVASDGTQGNGPSYKPSISADGRSVAFNSYADNLVPGDTNGMGDVFVHGRETEVSDCLLSTDRDGDGLPDGWEICGYYHERLPVGSPDVDLPAMGADPDIPDIFVEIDYMSNERCVGPICWGHTHKPKHGAIAAVVETFNNRGFQLHVDYGQDAPLGPGSTWGDLSRADMLEHQDTINQPAESWDDPNDWAGFDRIKAVNFQRAREPVFHYVIFAHTQGGTLGGQDNVLSSSGISRNRRDSIEAFRSGASDFVVSLGCFNSETVDCEGPPVGTELQQAGTFMHELGHNLGLLHGGDDHRDYEPNYLSVMNYSYQTDGLSQRQPDGSYLQGILDYSLFVSGIPDLNENQLAETGGMGGAAPFDTYGLRYFCRPPTGTACPAGSSQDGAWCNVLVEAPNSQDIDWNCDGIISSSAVRTSINDGDDRTRPSPTHEVLTGNHYEWDIETLAFNGGLIGRESDVGTRATATVASSDSDTQLIPLQELTGEVAATFYRPYAVSLGPSIDVILSAGVTTTLPITLTNLGSSAAVVGVNRTASNGWIVLDEVPSAVTLDPGASASYAVHVAVPNSATSGQTGEAYLEAVLEDAPNMGDSLTINVRIGPMARFDATGITGTVPHSVAFRDSSVGDISSWLWNFGDGFQSSEANPNHVYRSPGVYSVRLTVAGSGGTDTFTRAHLVRVEAVKVFLPSVRK